MVERLKIFVNTNAHHPRWDEWSPMFVRIVNIAHPFRFMACRSSDLDLTRSGALLHHRGFRRSRSRMIKRFYVTPESTYKTAGNNKVLSTPVVVVKTSELAHIFVAGRTARLPNGDVHPKGDMRGQIRLRIDGTRCVMRSRWACSPARPAPTRSLRDMPP